MMHFLLRAPIPREIEDNLLVVFNSFSCQKAPW